MSSVSAVTMFAEPIAICAAQRYLRRRSAGGPRPMPFYCDLAATRLLLEVARYFAS